MKAHEVEHQGETLNAYDVIQIINDYHGSEFDFTPESRNTGFFYMANSGIVVALRYDEAEDYVDQELASSDIVLMNHVELDSGSFNSPEELFGNGKHLLSSDGSPVAQAVDFIYSLADTGGQVERYYELGIETFDKLDASLWADIVNFFTDNLSDVMVEKIEALLDHYDPATTLYVNNLDWMTTATDPDAVTKIVFAQGISNIPPFTADTADTEGTGVFNLPDEIILPKTVKTVESNAFPEDVFGDTGNDVSIKYAGQGTLRVEDGELPDIPSVVFSRSKEAPLEESDGEVTYTVSGDTIDVDINALNAFLNKLDVTVKSYKIELDFDLSDNITAKVSIYTEEGYYGFINVEKNMN
jgi:hypothetical protein